MEPTDAWSALEGAAVAAEKAGWPWVFSAHLLLLMSPLEAISSFSGVNPMEV